MDNEAAQQIVINDARGELQKEGKTEFDCSVSESREGVELADFQRQGGFSLLTFSLFDEEEPFFGENS